MVRSLFTLVKVAGPSSQGRETIAAGHILDAVTTG
jgi:hypothetical protein